MKKSILLITTVLLFGITGCTSSNSFFSESPVVVQSFNILTPWGKDDAKIAIIVVILPDGKTVAIQSYQPTEKLTKIINSLKSGDKIHIKGEFETMSGGKWIAPKIFEIINLSSGMIYRH